MEDGKNNVWMQDLGEMYRLYNIYLNDQLYTIDQSKELLDHGNSHTQDQWNDWLKSKQNKEIWQLASGPVYHASLAALHYNQDHPDKKQRELIQQCRAMHTEDFQKYWMMTSTKIIYTPQGNDKIIHDYGTPLQKEIELNFVGPNKYITKKSCLENEIATLFGTADLDGVEQVYHDLTGEKPRLWRFNSKPNEETLRTLVLGVSRIDSNFVVVAGYYIYNQGCSRGWSVSPQDAPVFYDSSLRGALSLVGDAGNLSLAAAGNLSLK